ncbi:Nicotinate phosphoribosyltransferase [Balamuthia mandrillaris]
MDGGDEHQNLKPTSPFVNPLLTDQYQLTMAYAYWRNKKHEDQATFDLFFRKNPFRGEYTVFAGLEEVIRHVASFRFTEEQIQQIREHVLPNREPAFYEWLSSIDGSRLRLFAVKEGTVVFPKEPLVRVEGPVGVAQLLETTLLTLVNYASLVCTNAARHRRAAGPKKVLMEFGARRAQGPDGAISASRYSYMGGFDSTSNVLSGLLFHIKTEGTHAHSFVSSFFEDEDLHCKTLKKKTNEGDKEEGEEADFMEEVLRCRKELGYMDTSTAELKAFAAYALAFPNSCLCLVDTYDTLKSGIPNFLCVAYALHKFGYKAVGIRLDSGDLAYLSKRARAMFAQVGQRVHADYFSKFTIVASNELSEDTIYSLNHQGHEVDVFGVGTHLVTCQKQPALGCVYKLVEINGIPRIKISQDLDKVTLPGKKDVYRLYGLNGSFLFLRHFSLGFSSVFYLMSSSFNNFSQKQKEIPVVDLIVEAETTSFDRCLHRHQQSQEASSSELQETVPTVGKRIMCHHPSDPQKRAYITPTKVVPLLELVWDCGRLKLSLPSLEEIKHRCQQQVAEMREDHLRPLNPTPYKVSLSSKLWNDFNALWQESVPISDITHISE